MTGVSIERRGAFSGDVNPQDVAMAIQWVRKNIRSYGGDPQRIVIWGHSAGAMSVAEYIAQPRFYGSDGVGVRGAILMAGPYNIAPVEVKDRGFRLRMGKTGEVAGLPPLPTDSGSRWRGPAARVQNGYRRVRFETRLLLPTTAGASRITSCELLKCRNGFDIHSR